MRTWNAIGAAVVLALASVTARAAELELGDESPDLEVTAWIQGDEVQISENPDKRIRVVQFFNSYDQGCVTAAPDLEKLHTELTPKGVDLIAVTTQGEDAAREFVTNRKITYRVAVDQYNNTNAVFMKGVRRLPFAFVVDRDGRVAGMGAPDDGLRKIVEEVIDGTYDVDKAKKVAELRSALFQALQKQKPEEMAAAADAMLAVEPTDNLARSIRFQVFEQGDDVEGYLAYMKDYADKLKDDPKSLSWIAWRLVNSGNMAWRDVALAHQVSTRALELSEEKDGDILDTHARVLFELGLLEDAIRVAKQSIVLEDEDAAKSRLAHYEKCLELQKQLKKAADGSKKKRR